ncbi:MAG TPA: polyprenyl synthetase family protein [bacterium]|nr:polyprenyl synthetase family protein [bacterium]
MAVFHAQKTEATTNEAERLREVFRPVAAVLAKAQRKYESMLRTGVSEFLLEDFAIRNISSQSDFLDRMLETISSAQGKWLRAGITLLCTKVTGVDPITSVDVAVACEMIHTASLMHDDVLDGASLRRGQPSASSRWGNSLAVLGGDLLLALAFNLLTRSNSQACLEDISGSAVRVCLGEMAQQNASGSASVTEEEYLGIIDRKTASLFRSCARCGGLLGKAERPIVDALGDFGHSFGMAFQIVDDLLDFLSEDSFSGKTLGTDISQGKTTLATIHHLATKSPERRDNTVIAELEAEDLRKTGSLDFAFQKARYYSEASQEALGKIQTADSASLESLRSLSSFILERTPLQLLGR